LNAAAIEAVRRRASVGSPIELADDAGLSPTGGAGDVRVLVALGA